MIVAIHQPNYLPYLGVFDKMKKSDIFVIHDDCQFSERSWTHRNKIRIYNGCKWLTVPIEKDEISIKDIKINNKLQKNKPHWSKIHFREIHANYAKTEYFGIYEKEIKKIYETRYEKLIDLNMTLIKFLMKAFDIDKKIVFSSDLGLELKHTKKLVDIVELLGGDVYFSGNQAHDYLDTNLSLFGNIKVEFQNYKHPVYKQRYEGFVPYMSAIDALFNMGKMPE